jgi:hypothetical protein
MPTITLIGVARPSAHGQAMMRTATELVTAWARFWPRRSHARKVIAEMARTAGTNQAETLSARFWTGARLRWDSATSAMMRPRTVSEPVCAARRRNEPVVLTVPPVSGSPAVF